MQTVEAVVPHRGGVAIGGLHVGTLDLDGIVLTVGPGAVSNGYVASVDVSGSVRCARAFVSDANACVKALAAAPDGQLVVAGEYLVSMDAGLGPIESVGEYDSFLARLDEDCNPLWIRTWGSPSAQTVADVEVDGAGDVLVSGMSQTPAGLSADVEVDGYYLAKFTRDGEALWSRGLPDEAFLGIHPSGRIMLAGKFDSYFDLGGMPLEKPGSHDGYVALLESDGTHAWTRAFSGPNPQLVTDVVAMPAGDVVATGFASRVSDLGLGPTKGGDYDVFVTRLTADGETLWVRRFPGHADWLRVHVALDAHGHILLAGPYSENTNLGGTKLAGSGDDIFVGELDASGAHIWSFGIHGSAWRSVGGVQPDGDGGAFLAGYYHGALNTGPERPWLASAGAQDIFVARVGP